MDDPSSGVERRIDEYFDPEHWRLLRESDRVLRTLDDRVRRRHGGNHLVYVHWRDRSSRQVLNWHRLVHEYTISKLGSGPAAWFRQGGTKSPLQRLTWEMAAALCVHLDQHRRDIEKTLEAQT